MAWGRGRDLNAGVKPSALIAANRAKLLADYYANPPAEAPARPPRTQKEGKTHCKNGHEFTPENTYLTKSKVRVCRACMRKAGRERNKRQKEDREAGAFPRNFKLVWSVLLDGWQPTRQVRAWLTAERAWELLKAIRESSATGAEVWRGNVLVDPGQCERAAMQQAAERVYRVERAKLFEEVRGADIAYVGGKLARPWRGIDLDGTHLYAVALRAYIHSGFVERVQS